jgi:RND family efflux transporter MFP subunit
MSEMIKYNHDRTKDVFIPRSLMQYQHAAEEAALLSAKANATTPHVIEKEKLEVEKLQFEQKKATDHLDRLKKDRDKLLVSSPADGVLYYGRWHANKWTGSSDVSNKLHVGNNVQPQDLNLTVVQSGPLEIQAVIPEEDLDAVAPGAAGRFEPKSVPDSKISVKLDKVSAAPQSEGQFGALFTIDGKSPEGLVAGMTGKVRIVAYFKADAIAVPMKAVFRDDVDEDKRYVLVVDKSGKHERRDVTVGRENDKSIEITKGLSTGDKILLEKPGENADN